MTEDALKVGQKFKWQGYLTHVVTLFDDDDRQHAVLKRWSSQRQRWMYSVEPFWLIVEMARKVR